MYIRKALKFLVAVELVAALFTTLIVAYRHESTALGIANIATIVALAIGGLGGLVLRGARLGGDGPIQTDMAVSVTQSPNAVRWADYEDMAAGLSFGVILVVGAVLWLVVVMCGYKLFS